MRNSYSSGSNLYPLNIALFIIFTASFIFAAPIADKSSKFLGNITNGTPPSNYADYWNQITLENGGKWGSVQPSNQNNFNWNQTDEAYEYCKSNGWPFKHHCFVWGNQQPSWVNSGNARAAVENYIKTFGERYPETDFIDVVNEPLNAPAGYRQGLGGSGTTGWDWIVTVFELARKYCPNSKLLINEYNIVSNMNNAIRYMNIVKILKEKDLIDGIGLQSHCFNLEKTDARTVQKVLDTLATTGLPLYSSEFDLRGDETTQLNRYKTFFPIFWEHPAVKGVTLWGWTSNWRGAVIMSGDREFAALKWLRTYVDSLGLTSVSKKLPDGSSEIQPSPISFYSAGQKGIRLRLNTPGEISLTVTDPSGRAVFRANHILCTQGDNLIPWLQKSLSKGAYMVIVKGFRFRFTGKIVL